MPIGENHARALCASACGDIHKGAVRHLDVLHIGFFRRVDDAQKHFLFDFALKPRIAYAVLRIFADQISLSVQNRNAREPQLLRVFLQFFLIAVKRTVLQRVNGVLFAQKFLGNRRTIVFYIAGILRLDIINRRNQTLFTIPLIRPQGSEDDHAKQQNAARDIDTPEFFS